MKCDEMCCSASASGSTAWGTSGRSERNVTERLDERSIHSHRSRLKQYTAVGLLTTRSIPCSSARCLDILIVCCFCHLGQLNNGKDQ